MKKRRTLIISLLLVAALCIGIGYAGVSTQLKVIGTATSSQQAIDVVFTGGEIKGATSTEEAVKTEIQTNSEHKYETPAIEVKPIVKGLTHQNDSITFTYTITNRNDYAVTLAKPKITMAGTTVLSVTTSMDDITTKELAADASTTIDVTVKLAIVSADPITETFTVSIEAYAGNQGAVQNS